MAASRSIRISSFLPKHPSHFSCKWTGEHTHSNEIRRPPNTGSLKCGPTVPLGAGSTTPLEITQDGRIERENDSGGPLAESHLGGPTHRMRLIFRAFMTLLANLFFLIQVDRAFSPYSQYFPVARGLTVDVDLSCPTGGFHGRSTFSVPWVIDYRCFLAPNYVPAYDSPAPIARCLDYRRCPPRSTRFYHL